MTSPAPSCSSHTILVADLGRTRYAAAYELQRRIFSRRADNTIPDILLLTEHQPVYTLGRGADDNHLLAGREELLRAGVDVCPTDRGGDVTYHGPGQIVGYPILNLASYYCDLHRYLRDIEEVMIRTCADYRVLAHRDPGFTGVWVGSDKIGAIGIKVAHWVTMHGFAFNVAMDLSGFGRIIPCGIFHRGVTSLEVLLGRQVPVRQVVPQIVIHVGEVFGATMKECAAADLEDLLQESLHEVMGGGE